MRLMDKFCLVPTNWQPNESDTLVWHTCTSNANYRQWRWDYLTSSIKKTVRRRSSNSNRTYRLFQLADKRFAVYRSDHQQGTNFFIAKLSSTIRDWRAQFVYDARTKSMRVASRRSYVIGGH